MSRDLSRSDVHVWYRLTHRFDEERMRSLKPLLSRDELARVDRIRSASDRRDYVAAHALLRQALSRYSDRQPHEWIVQYGRHGKPALAEEHDTSLVFNLSHTHGLVACAIARDTLVGIDVERVTQSVDAMGISARHFSQSERRMLSACPPELRNERFVELWTLKEALLKAIGTGMGGTRSLDAWSFQFVGDSDVGLRAADGGDADWQCALAAPTPHHRLALVARCGSGQQPYRVLMRDMEEQPAPLEPLRHS